MLEVVPITRENANTFIREHHRNHGVVRGHLFAIGVAHGLDLVGVLIVGRPVARHLDDGKTCEVTRCCTDGTRNACSKLYRAGSRAASAMGYKKVITYTEDGEPGTSLLASAFVRSARVRAEQWDRSGRHRPIRKAVGRSRWEVVLDG